MDEFLKKNVCDNNYSYNNSISNILKKGKDKIHSFNTIKTINSYQTNSKANIIKTKLRTFLYEAKENKNNVNNLYNNKSTIKDAKNNISTIFKKVTQHNSSKIDNDQHSNTISIYNNNCQSSKFKIKRMVSKKSCKCSLIKKVEKQNQSIKLNKQNMAISTYFLFRNAKLCGKETIKAYEEYKSNKKLFINYYTKNDLNNSFSIESKIYNSNKNIINPTEKTLQKNNINNKNKNNISTQALNRFNTNHSIIRLNRLKVTPKDQKKSQLIK